MCDKDIYISDIVDQKKKSMTRIVVELKNELNLFLRDKETGLNDVQNVGFTKKSKKNIENWRFLNGFTTRR